jgi:hypothetical protein
MKKLSLLLIMLFVLFGCTSTPKRAAVTQKTSATKELKKKDVIPGLTLKNVLNAFESSESESTLEAIKNPDPKDSRLLWFWSENKAIKSGSAELSMTFSITGYSENEIESFHIVIGEAPSKHNAQSFEAEVLEILSCVAKIPIEGVDNSKVEKWIKEDALKHAEQMSFFIDNNIAYNLNNEGPGSAKIFTIIRYEKK